MRRTFRSIIVIAAASTCAALPRAVRAQDDSQSGTVVIRGATIFTASERGTIDGGSVVLRKGKILRVGGPRRRPAPAMPGVETIDASGKYVTPGLIDAWTLMALDPGGPVGASASLRAVDAIDFFQASHFADAWRGGGAQSFHHLRI